MCRRKPEVEPFVIASILLHVLHVAVEVVELRVKKFQTLEVVFRIGAIFLTVKFFPDCTHAKYWWHHFLARS